MKFIALVSGGKDSCYSILHSIRQGHELVALGNLYPNDEERQELDSFMFQTVGHNLVKWYETCTGLPLVRRAIRPETSRNVCLNYYPTEEDEIEDLLELLIEAKRQIPDLEAVNAGAILSSYQRTRVEDVCSRLGLVSLSYLWQRDQKELMTEMCLMSKQSGEDNSPKLDARLIKTAAIGLDQSSLGKSLPQVFPLLQRLNERYDVHICGEGGEFETMVFDAPFFKHGYLEPHIVRVEGCDNSDGVYSAVMGVSFIERECSTSMDQLLENLPVPRAVEDHWLELANYVGVFETPTTENHSRTASKSSHTPHTSINKIGNLLYVSNLTPKTGDSTQSKSQDVFKQLNDVLKENRLFASQILSSSLLLENMSDFATVNLLYNGFFQVQDNGPLPPSRACVGSSLVGHNKTLQLSVVIDTEAKITEQKGMVLNDSKNGLHVQGRSYWAPCNIGPYSQAIWKKEDQNQVSYISGQIALVAASMEMTTSLEPHLDEDISQAVLALRHFDTLKRTINAQEQLTTVCYVSRHSMVPVVAKVWSLYCKDMVDSSEWWFEKPVEDPRSLIIVKVSELPRQAKCEWGGVACSKVSIIDEEQDDSDTDTADSKNSTDDAVGAIDIGDHFECHQSSVRSPKTQRKYLTGHLNSQKELVKLVSSCSNSQVILFYSPNSDLSLGTQKPGFELYPVENVYDYEGHERFAAFQVIVETTV
ncbi:LAME_0G11584g1_1 [Lachancea meyersii CBS 8951]|uniref:Diphthine--ammonia ligase n=1 Tax=Lachancea meyersii CBS 8951 TaxID=1266667 RepID=A0A1G4K9D0_9SACH|nr:LAME_0G11584g1_1 [Lachancea meyersii CBS 8951]